MTSDNEKVPDSLRDYAKLYFDLHASDFSHLDNKALGVFGIVGILLSFQIGNMDILAEFVSASRNKESPCILCFIILTLVLYGVSLFIAIIYAFRSFQVRDLLYPTATSELVNRYRSSNANDPSNQLDMDIVKSLANSSDNLEQENGKKAGFLKKSVLFVLLSLIILGVYLMLSVIYNTSK